MRGCQGGIINRPTKLKSSNVLLEAGEAFHTETELLIKSEMKYAFSYILTMHIRHAHATMRRCKGNGAKRACCLRGKKSSLTSDKKTGGVGKS